jgi:hypothetical protein
MLPTLSRSVNVDSRTIWSEIVRKCAASTITPPRKVWQHEKQLSLCLILPKANTCTPHVRRALIFRRARARPKDQRACGVFYRTCACLSMCRSARRNRRRAAANNSHVLSITATADIDDSYGPG